ncbi:chromosomal replication initiator DnaA [Aquicoccus sp. SCR17]|nr:chromosomal replication initiator DnaA [Carideicomes alvinocaridis]
MARQLSFDLPVRTALGREDFFVSPANALAVAQIDAWRDWPGRKLLLYGPEGAGKTHLAHVWAAESGARVIAADELPGADIPGLAAGHVAVEDVDRIAGNRPAQEALFHLHNLALAEGHAVLLTGTAAPAGWPLTLPDLKSRIQGTQAARLDPPDDALLEALLLKLFADRQLAPRTRLIRWLVPRMGRSFRDAQELVARLDSAALTSGRPLDLALARSVLDSDGADA